jgi:hypothetical protein
VGKSTRLLFRRSGVQIPATTWWLTTIRNEIWCLLLGCLKTATVYLHIINKSLKKNKKKKNIWTETWKQARYLWLCHIYKYINTHTHTYIYIYIYMYIYIHILLMGRTDSSKFINNKTKEHYRLSYSLWSVFASLETHPAGGTRTSPEVPFKAMSRKRSGRFKREKGAWLEGVLTSFPVSVIKYSGKAGRWWRRPLILAFGRQRQADFWVQGQPGLQSEFQDSQDYTEKPCLKKPTNQTNKQNPLVKETSGWRVHRAQFKAPGLVARQSRRQETEAAAQASQEAEGSARVSLYSALSPLQWSRTQPGNGAALGGLWVSLVRLWVGLSPQLRNSR